MQRVTGPNAKHTAIQIRAAARRVKCARMNAPRDWLTQKTDLLKIHATWRGASAMDECTA
jgi:hypothetical protein